MPLHSHFSAVAPLAISVILALPAWAQTKAKPITRLEAPVGLLTRVLATMERPRTLDTISEIQLIASGQNSSFAYRERLHLVLQKPGCYFSDVSLFSPDGTPGPKFKVISDGVKVWVYQPGTHTYSSLTHRAFEEDDLSGLGLLGSLIIDSTGDSGGDLDLKRLRRSGLKVDGGRQRVSGKEYAVLAISDPKQSYKLRLLLDTQTAQVHQLGLDGQQKQTAFRVVETVIRQSSPPPLPAPLFHFHAPVGVRRVEKISIGLF